MRSPPSLLAPRWPAALSGLPLSGAPAGARYGCRTESRPLHRVRRPAPGPPRQWRPACAQLSWLRYLPACAATGQRLGFGILSVLRCPPPSVSPHAPPNPGELCHLRLSAPASRRPSAKTRLRLTTNQLNLIRPFFTVAFLPSQWVAL